jgi:hypothetical protein
MESNKDAADGGTSLQQTVSLVLCSTSSSVVADDPRGFRTYPRFFWASRAYWHAQLCLEGVKDLVILMEMEKGRGENDGGEDGI